jgi:hypothetical protein
MLTRALNVFGNTGEPGVILRLLKIFHKDSIGLETFSSLTELKSRHINDRGDATEDDKKL